MSKLSFIPKRVTSSEIDSMPIAPGTIYYIESEDSDNTLVIAMDTVDSNNTPIRRKLDSSDTKLFDEDSGKSITLDDVSDSPLIGLKLYGKSTQDGTPTPDVPVDIVSVGDSGSIEVKACGKNLFPWNDYTKAPINNWGLSSGCTHKVTSSEIQMEVAPNTNGSGGGVFIWQDNYKDLISPYYGNTFTISYELRADSEITVRHGFEIGGIYVDSVVGTAWKRFSCSTTIKKPCNICWKTINQPETILYIRKIQIEIGDTATDYEPYKGTTATITSALPLCGIPVSEGGNYTDSNGQQWVCDELIYNADGTGKIIKRIEKIKLSSGNMNKYEANNKRAIHSIQQHIVDGNSLNYTKCNCLIPAHGGGFSYETGGKYYINNQLLFVYTQNFGIETELDWKNYVDNNDFVVYHAVKTPTIIELTATEVDALRQLQTFDGVTNISNSAGADMYVKYWRDETIPSLINNMTGATSDVDGKAGLVPAPTVGDIDKFLRGDGTWVVPTNTTYSAATQSANGLMSAADKKKLDGIAAGANAYTHPTYSTKSSGLYKITVDGTGHVSAATAVTKDDITALGFSAGDTDTHYTSKNVVGSSTATSNTTSALTNGNVYLNSVENGVVTSAHKISGSGATTVTTDANGNIIISSTDTNTNTTYTAGTGLSLSGTTFNHSNSVTAGTAQGDASKTLTFGGTFTIPTVTYDAQGHITGKGTTKMTMPANPNTWRGIQNNLTSDSTTDSLSAAQGKVLKGLVDGKADASHTHSYLPLSGGTMSGALHLSYDTSNVMTYGSTNPQIIFSENGSQPVKLVYSDYDSYRIPAGLKVIGGDGANPAWFEVEGTIYAAGFSGSLSGNASSATKATQDSAGQQINTTYIKGLSVSGTTITITKGDGSTSTVTTQDTNTDTKVTNTLNKTAKAYVTGTTSSSTNTGTQVFDTGVYLDTTAGMLTATTFKGALSGNASTSNKLKSTSYITISIATSDWSTNSSGGYVCTKSLSSAMAYTNFNFDVVLSTDQSAAKLQIESWNNVIADGEITQTTSSGSTTAFTFYAFTTKPSVALTVGIQGVS